MEQEEYQKKITELEQQLAVKEEIIQEFFVNRSAWKKKVAKLEYQLQSSGEQLAMYQEMCKNHRKHQFMYWFLLKTTAEVVLNPDKTPEQREELALEILSAFQEDFQNKEG